MRVNLKRLRGNKALIGYLVNSSWMISEYALKIIAALFVSIYVARYLGPERFGVISYALAVVAVFMVVSRLGMESILVRDLARHSESRESYLGTAFWLMLIAALLSNFCLALMTYFFEKDSEIQLYIWIISIGMIFQSFLAIDYNFQSQVKAKYSSLAKSSALALGSVVKISLVVVQADIFWFAAAYALDQVIIAILLSLMHVRLGQVRFLLNFKAYLVKPLLRSAWPMVLSGVAAVLYMRIDQLMIKNMLGAHDLGLYSAAAKIYEGWVIVPYVISISLLPAIVKLKAHSAYRYEDGMAKLFALVFWPGIGVAIIISIFGDSVVLLTFGSEYLGATNALIISMWAVAFTGLGAVTSRYLTVEGLETKIALRTLIALLINVILNYFFIPIYGMEGAAAATLITILIANYLINYTDSSLKSLVRICNNAITLNFLFKEMPKS